MPTREGCRPLGRLPPFTDHGHHGDQATVFSTHAPWESARLAPPSAG
ncbi:hypothetical protein ACGFRB_12920 [Streptomyces sp. NPDC048718]